MPLSSLGRALESARQNAKGWKRFFFGALAATVILNLVIHNHHPHFGVDAVPGFWAVFGLGVGVLMVLFVKKIVQPLIKRPEDFYGDL